MKVMVTGGAGFIGSHIVDLLVKEGNEVIVVDNLVTGKKENINLQAKFYELDILDPQLEKIMQSEAPEIIIHLAALVYVQQSLQKPLEDGKVNVLGTLNILRLARSYGVKKVIYASTCAVYGESQGKWSNENDSINPISFYGASKYMAESYIQLFNKLYNLDFTILRYGNVYGPRQSNQGEGGVIPIFLEKIQGGIPPLIYGDGSQTRDFIYVKDVCRANLLAIKQGSAEILNIGTGIGTTINDLLKTINNISQCSVQPLYKSKRLGDVKHICLDPTKAKEDLGWQPNYSLQQGLIETVGGCNGEKDY